MKNVKYLLCIIIGFILSIGISNAYKLNANLVTYDKKNTTLESEDVQGAIDELGLLANTLTDTSDATASASDILSGKTAYVNGTKITGTYEAKGAPKYVSASCSFISQVSNASSFSCKSGYVENKNIFFMNAYNYSGSFPSYSEISFDYSSDGTARLITSTNNGYWRSLNVVYLQNEDGTPWNYG